ncbi:MAG: hypothetical protein WKF77_01755 [Planctomycetaceae bacterium]
MFAASIKDGRNQPLHRRLFIVETSVAGERRIHEPTILHDITPAPIGVAPPEVAIPDKSQSERFLYERTLEPWCAKESAIREQEVSRVSKHVAKNY